MMIGEDGVKGGGGSTYLCSIISLFVLAIERDRRK